MYLIQDILPQIRAQTEKSYEGTGRETMHGWLHNKDVKNPGYELKTRREGWEGIQSSVRKETVNFTMLNVSLQ